MTKVLQPLYCLISVYIVQVPRKYNLSRVPVTIFQSSTLIPWITVRNRADTFSNDAAQVLLILSLVAIKPVVRVSTQVMPKLSLVMRKPDFRICENKDADQLRGNREADQRLCFRYTDSTIPPLPKSEISSV